MELAPRKSRFFAQAIDISLAALFLLPIAGPETPPPTPILLTLGLALVVLLFLQAALLWKRGQTLGKIALKIRIVRADTGINGGFVPNLLVRIFLNNLIISIPFLGLLYVVVDVLFIFREDRRCLHDLLAKTQVVPA